MDNQNLLEAINIGTPIVQAALSGVVSGLLSRLFLRGGTSTTEFEKIKAGKFSEVVDELLKDGKMSFYEFYKCKNFLHIAQIADQQLQANDDQNSKSDNNQTFDFDWYVRLFEAAGNISSEDMQRLWARVLTGEIENKGSFSLRTLETLKNLSKEEAELFQKAANFVLMGQNGLRFILCMSNDFGVDVNEENGIGREEFIRLEECGILSSLRSDNRIDLRTYPSGIWNDNIILLLKYKRKDGALGSYKYSCYTLTPSANQLLTIISRTPDDDYLLSIGRELGKKYSGNLETLAYRIIDPNLDSFRYDDSVNLLKASNMKKKNK